MEAPTLFKHVSCINYLFLFKKEPANHVSALIDSASEFNTMYPAYAKKLGLDIRKTDVGAQKFDSTTLETFGIVIAVFSMHDKAKKAYFFEEIFLLADISMDVALGMFFLILRDADVCFTNQKLH